MKVYTNDKRIREKQRIGIIFSSVGLVVSLVALFLIWQPRYAWLAWVVIIIGLGISTVGTYHVNRWLRPPLPEPLLNDVFQRWDARHVLMHHFGHVPHLLLTPRGLIAIHVKRYEGPVRYDRAAQKWQGKFSLRRFYGHGLTAEGLGNPTEEVARAVSKMKGWLQVHLPELAEEVPVEGMALFLSPKAELVEVNDSPVTLALPDTIKRAVQSIQSDNKALPRETYRRLREALESEVADDLGEAA